MRTYIKTKSLYTQQERGAEVGSRTRVSLTVQIVFRASHTHSVSLSLLWSLSSPITGGPRPVAVAVRELHECALVAPSSQSPAPILEENKKGGGGGSIVQESKSREEKKEC